MQDYRRITVAFRPEIYEKLKASSERLGIGMSTLVQWIVGTYLNSVEKIEPTVLATINEIIRKTLKESEQEEQRQ